ncbi:hypothetical protein BDN67DRAFT_985056, partial [Paxillus ammoniavirescens]
YSPNNKNPHNIATLLLPTVHVLRDALKKGDCYFYKMTPRKHREFKNKLKVRHSTGETISAPRKKCSDAGRPHKHRQGKENNPPLKRARTAAQSAPPKSKEFCSTDEDKDATEGDEDGDY